MSSGIVACLLKLFCHGIAAITYLSIFADVRETVNNEKSFNCYGNPKINFLHYCRAIKRVVLLLSI
jgi:hypothetical protein